MSYEWVLLPESGPFSERRPGLVLTPRVPPGGVRAGFPGWGGTRALEQSWDLRRSGCRTKGALWRRVQVLGNSGTELNEIPRSSGERAVY